mmetsp:Transcript_17152/g.36796  ORF Transcript_17152/g.36796 Transcript_17152/m.36796 type:complete len:204 (-) Transcript_17152:877-1488(-)
MHANRRSDAPAALPRRLPRRRCHRRLFAAHQRPRRRRPACQRDEHALLPPQHGARHWRRQPARARRHDVFLAGRLLHALLLHAAAVALAPLLGVAAANVAQAAPSPRRRDGGAARLVGHRRVHAHGDCLASRTEPFRPLPRGARVRRHQRRDAALLRRRRTARRGGLLWRQLDGDGGLRTALRRLVPLHGHGQLHHVRGQRGA